MNKKKIILIASICLVFAGLVVWNIFQEIRYYEDPLETSFREFQEMLPEEFHVRWHRKHCKSVYVLDCRTQYDEWNCSVAVWGMLIDLGANLDFKNAEGKYINTNEIQELLKFHSYRIKRAKDIKGINIVIFKPNKNEIPHVAFLERVNHRKNILLLEMNVASGGTNYRWIKFDDWRIEGIYPVTLGLWKGE